MWKLHLNSSMCREERQRVSTFVEGVLKVEGGPAPVEAAVSTSTSQPPPVRQPIMLSACLHVICPFSVAIHVLTYQ